jgi:hypothetical protein
LARRHRRAATTSGRVHHPTARHVFAAASTATARAARLLSQAAGAARAAGAATIAARATAAATAQASLHIGASHAVRRLRR